MAESAFTGLPVEEEETVRKEMTLLYFPSYSRDIK